LATITSLDGIVVLGGPAQRGGPLLHLDDPRQRAVVARHVSVDRHPVAHHDAPAAERSGLHRQDDAPLDEQREPPAVDGDDHAVGGVVVAGPLLGAGRVRRRGRS
jgi:hypothetical protein